MPKKELTLTKSEIAFLDALIELLREETSGTTERVTIRLDDHQVLFDKVRNLARVVTKVVGNWVQQRRLINDAYFRAFAGAPLTAAEDTAADIERISPELRDTLSSPASLEQLIALRERFR